MGNLPSQRQRCNIISKKSKKFPQLRRSDNSKIKPLLKWLRSRQIRLQCNSLNSLIQKTLHIIISLVNIRIDPIKLAKRFTGRHELISMKNAYHGSTLGALSVMGDEEFKNSFILICPTTWFPKTMPFYRIHSYFPILFS